MTLNLLKIPFNYSENVGHLLSSSLPSSRLRDWQRVHASFTWYIRDVERYYGEQCQQYHDLANIRCGRLHPIHDEQTTLFEHTSA